MFIIAVNYFLIFLISVCASNQLEIDPNGYILYCPCMGRFGNQADHFLGSLGFAHGINRTLVLPPWIEYRKNEINSIQVPFDQYFQVTKLKEFHRVITMELFMKNIAPTLWPSEKRISFCYMERQGIGGGEYEKKSCNAKDGNPFRPFWDTFNVDFVGSEFYGPLHYDVHHTNIAEKWALQYSPEKWPVIAFTGAPATFPVQKENRDLHKYLHWSKEIEQAAKNFIKTKLRKGAFIGIHLRNGIDWIRACEHIPNSPNLFSSAQCLGYRNEKGSVTMDMCMPSREIIIKQVKRQIKKMKDINKNNEVRTIFVASDNSHLIKELNESLHRMKIIAIKLNENNPHLDLAILGLANHFIGNCVSSFSAFVKRERDSKNFPSSFWAYPTEKINLNNKQKHEEL